MPRDLVELKKQVKAANDILDVVAGYTSVVPAGKISKCLCPFHNDTRPSMQLDRSYQNYHCWACGAKGDVFDVVEKFEKVGFKEALAILARRAGIRIDGDAPADIHKVKLFEVMAWAGHIYQECLLESDLGAAARKYLGERRLAGATVRQFGLGFAPLDGDWLVKVAARDKVPTDILIEVGLLAERDENRGQYDRFRDRVMFPIRDVQQRIVGFGGRIMPTSPYAARGPKYYNSAETPLFKKSDCLYGLDLARHDGAKAGFLAVVEGYTDVMAAHQAGVTNVVATMGTALNGAHVAQLRRYVPRVVLVFDADEGGITGVDRALEIFVGQDAELAVATLPRGLDPADLFAEPDGKATFEDVLSSAKDALDFKLDSLLAKDTGGVDSARRMVDAVLGVMALAPGVPGQASAVKQDLMLTRLAQRLGVRLEVVRNRFRELQLERRRQVVRDTERAKAMPMASAARVTAPPAGAKPITSQRTALERQLLQILLTDPTTVPSVMAAVPADRIEHSGIRRILTELYALAAAGEPADMDALRVRLIDRPDLATAALDNQHIGRGMGDRPEYLAKVLAGFGRMHAEEEKRAVKEQLNNAADPAAALDRLRALQDLSRAKAPPPPPRDDAP